MRRPKIITTRLTSGAGTRQIKVSCQFTETMLTAILSIAVMLSVNWQLTLICLVPAPLVSLVVIIFGRRIHDRFEVIQKMFSDISSRVQENLSGVRVIRAYAQEDAETHK